MPQAIPATSALAGMLQRCGMSQSVPAQQQGFPHRRDHPHSGENPPAGSHVHVSQLIRCHARRHQHPEGQELAGQRPGKQ